MLFSLNEVKTQKVPAASPGMVDAAGVDCKHPVGCFFVINFMIKYTHMTLSYLYFAFSGIFNTSVSIILGLLFLLHRKENKANKIFVYFCLAVAVWSLTYVAWPLAQTSEETLRAFQILHIPACFVSILYLHFVVRWLGLYEQKKKIVYIGYLLSVLFSLSTFSPYFIVRMVPKFSMRFWAVPGPLYHWYLILFFGLFLYSSYLLIRRLQTEQEKVRRMQIKFILFGIVTGFLGGSTNYFLWYDINFPPYGNILVSFFVISTAYAIIRYKLLNIKVIATEGFLLLINLFLIFQLSVSNSSRSYFINGFVLLITLIMSYLLVISVKKEVKRREEVTTLAHSLEKANLRLQQLDRQKTEFLSIASHQLRTPLSILKGYIELIKDGGFGKPTKGIVKVLGDMDDNNEHLIKLVDEFLNISRIEQGRTKFVFESSNLWKIIEGAKNELEMKAKDRGVELVLDKAKKDKNIILDSEKVRHVIFNFIDNAIKYSEKGKIKILIEDEDGGTTVRVRDQGFGFEKVDEANFFQKFYRGENVKGTNVTGTGLGLYVCRKFIEAHGGKVWAHSPGLGKGSEFGFWLPPKPSV